MMAGLGATPMAWVVRFSEPWWLLSLAAALVPPALAVWARGRGRHVPAAGVALQVLAVVLAAGALARPAMPIGRTADKVYLVLRDASASTRTQAGKPLPWAQDVPREVYDFAGTVERSRQRQGELPSTAPGLDQVSLERDRTCLSPALRLAGAQRGRLAGVVIQTDGQFQDTDWPTAAQALARAGLDVVIMPMASPPPDARIADLSAERTPGGTVGLRITAASNAPVARRLIVRRRGLAGPILDRRLDLLAESPATIRLTDAPPGDQAAVYAAALSPSDTFPQNDSAEAIVLPDTSRAAVVAQPGANLPDLRAALGMKASDIDPARAPGEVAGWLDYAVVVLVDAQGTLLGPTQRAALAQYVRGGGGLVLVGCGPHAEPDDRQDPLNRTSPLVANPFERRPMAVIVALDASGSMAEQAAESAGPGGRIRFDAAVEATLSLKRHLTARDSLAVVTFCDEARPVYQSGASGPDFAALRDALASVRPGGSTNVMKAIQCAAAVPTPPDRQALLILLSDLIPTHPFDPAKAAALIRGKGLRLAVVGVLPPGKSPPQTAALKQLAGDLDSPLVLRDRLTGLAEVFATFLKHARGDVVRRGRWQVAGGGTAFGLPVANMPPLDAYVLCGAREAAEVMLRVGDDPLLARCRAGLGRSVCLAVPLAGADNTALGASKYLADLLAAAAHWALRPGDDPRFEGQVQTRPGGLDVVLTARDASGPMNGLSLTLEIARPQDLGASLSQEVSFTQTAPGRYEARTAVGAGPVSLAVRDAQGRVVFRQALAAGPGPEFAKIGPNWQNLRGLAELTGGRIASEADLWQQARAWDSARYTPVWPALLAGALALMLLEWCLVRVWRRGA